MSKSTTFTEPVYYFYPLDAGFPGAKFLGLGGGDSLPLLMGGLTNEPSLSGAQNLSQRDGERRSPGSTSTRLSAPCSSNKSGKIKIKQEKS